TAREWHKKKIGINLGLVTTNTQKKIKAVLENINSGNYNHAFTKQRYVDGLGARRAVCEILKISQYSP
ncbi:MAG: hypothetical protein QXE82_00485, partial [Candidatus Nitrosotenuis sp.]